MVGGQFTTACSRRREATFRSLRRMGRIAVAEHPWEFRGRPIGNDGCERACGAASLRGSLAKTNRIPDEGGAQEQGYGFAI